MLMILFSFFLSSKEEYFKAPISKYFLFSSSLLYVTLNKIMCMYNTLKRLSVKFHIYIFIVCSDGQIDELWKCRHLIRTGLAPPFLLGSSR